MSTMRLIGAGMPRTGTLTQKVALETLGISPCYHWVDVLADLEHQVPLWNGVMDGGVALPAILDGYGSTVDWPGGFFVKQLIDEYPDAKVLLSVRDAERWEPSFRETIVNMSHGESMIRLLSSARAEIDPQWAQYLAFVERIFWGPEGTFPRGDSPEQLIEGFNRHTEEIKRIVPAERLLVWEAAEGWEPLCAFLDVPVPDEPFPHANDRDTFLGRVIGGAMAALNQWHATAGAA
jgi:Sulfotransferase domain